MITPISWIRKSITSAGIHGVSVLLLKIRGVIEVIDQYTYRGKKKRPRSSFFWLFFRSCEFLALFFFQDCLCETRIYATVSDSVSDSDDNEGGFIFGFDGVGLSSFWVMERSLNFSLSDSIHPEVFSGLMIHPRRTLFHRA